MRPAAAPLGARLLALAALAVLTACNGRLERAPAASSAAAGEPASRPESTASEQDAGPATEGGFSSEAERTRAMETQAADLRQQYEEAMASATTEEEKIRAYQEFEQGRQELDEMSEGDLGESDDAYPPPPQP